MTNTLPAEFDEFVNASVMDQIFNLAHKDMRWRMWVTATSVSQHNWHRIVQMLIDDGIDMETWLAAAVSYREALAGTIEWIVI